MAKNASHYVKQATKKPYLKKREWIILGCILGALALGVGGYCAVRAIFDDSLPVENGRVITGEGDWLIVNEGSSSDRKYYRYAEYDFSALDARIEFVPFSNDENLGEVYVYPNDKSYDYACVYGNKFKYDELAPSVQSQMSALLPNGAVGALSEVDFDGRPALTYNYYSYETENDEDGIPLHDENGEEIRTYTQIFSCYILSEREGCVVARVGFKRAAESELLTDAQGIEKLSEIVNCLNFDVNEK